MKSPVGEGIFEGISATDSTTQFLGPVSAILTLSRLQQIRDYPFRDGLSAQTLVRPYEFVHRQKDRQFPHVETASESLTGQR
jgi:hypothetical protein